MKITLYWRASPPCPFCKQAKELLAERGIPHESIEIGVDISRDAVKSLFPQATTVPVVTIDGEYIGGFTELKQYLNK